MLGSFWSAWRLENLAFSLRVSSKSSLSLFSPRTLPGTTKIIQKTQTYTPKHPKRYPRGAQERSGASRESPKSSPKPPPERSEGILGRPKGFLGWFWEPWGLIWEPPGSVYDRFCYCSRASLLSLFLSSFSLLSSISHLIPLFSLLSSLVSLLSSLLSLRVSLRSLQRRGGFREATGIRRPLLGRGAERVKSRPKEPKLWQGQRALRVASGGLIKHKLSHHKHYSSAN